MCGSAGNTQGRIGLFWGFQQPQSCSVWKVYGAPGLDSVPTAERKRNTRVCIPCFWRKGGCVVTKTHSVVNEQLGQSVQPVKFSPLLKAINRGRELRNIASRRYFPLKSDESLVQEKVGEFGRGSWRETGRVKLNAKEIVFGNIQETEGKRQNGNIYRRHSFQFEG